MYQCLARCIRFDARANSSISAMRPPCYYLLEEIVVLGVIYGSLMWMVCNPAAPAGPRGIPGLSPVLTLKPRRFEARDAPPEPWKKPRRTLDEMNGGWPKLRPRRTLDDMNGGWPKLQSEYIWCCYIFICTYIHTNLWVFGGVGTRGLDSSFAARVEQCGDHCKPFRVAAQVMVIGTGTRKAFKMHVAPAIPIINEMAV